MLDAVLPNKMCSTAFGKLVLPLETLFGDSQLLTLLPATCTD